MYAHARALTLTYTRYQILNSQLIIMLQLEVYTKMLIFANNSSTKKKNFTPAPSNLDTLQEDREKLRAQIETQVRAEFERRLRDEVRVKVDEELKKHDGMHVHLRV